MYMCYVYLLYVYVIYMVRCNKSQPIKSSVLSTPRSGWKSSKPPLKAGAFHCHFTLGNFRCSKVPSVTCMGVNLQKGIGPYEFTNN